MGLNRPAIDTRGGSINRYRHRYRDI